MIANVTRYIHKRDTLHLQTQHGSAKNITHPFGKAYRLRRRASLVSASTMRPRIAQTETESSKKKRRNWGLRMFVSLFDAKLANKSPLFTLYSIKFYIFARQMCKFYLKSV